MNIAEKIIANRKAKNLTQTQLADLLFVSDKTVSKWETGRGYPEISILPKLASVLGTTVDDLLKEDETLPTSSNPSGKGTTDELPSSDLSSTGEATENKFVLPRSKSLIVWIGTVFIPMGLLIILSMAVMFTGYANAVETGLLLFLVNGLSRGIIGLTLYLSFKDSRALLIYAISSMIFTTIGTFSNIFDNGGLFGELSNVLSLVVYLGSIATNILVILFAYRKVNKATSIVVLLWITFGIGLVISLMTFRTDFFINSLNDFIMILVGISTVIGFTRLYPRFEMRRVPVAKQSTFFKDPA